MGVGFRRQAAAEWSMGAQALHLGVGRLVGFQGLGKVTSPLLLQFFHCYNGHKHNAFFTPVTRSVVTQIKYL